jgi:uncharacterized protein (TIGR03435 family)
MTMIAFLGEWIVRSSVLILAGMLLLRLLRIKNPSVRLAAYTAMLAGSLSMPLLTAALPKLPLLVIRPPAESIPDATPQLTLQPVEMRTTIPDSISTPTPPEPVRAMAFDLMRFAGILYVIAVIALLVRLVVGLVMSLRILRRSHPAGIMADGSEVRESGRVASPFTIGVFRPAILLPLDWRNWDSAKLDAVLAHERSHIRRCDPVVQFVSAIHRALLWANPLSWILDRSIIRTAELISDDDAVAATRDRVSYAEILLEFVQRGANRTRSLGVSMARYDRPEKRIRRILNSAVVPRAVTGWGIAAILGLGTPLAYLAGAASPQSRTAQDKPASAEQPPFELAGIKPLDPTGASSGALPGYRAAAAIAESGAGQDRPATAKLLKFEVASIKPVEDGTGGMMGVRVYPGGRVTISRLPLRSLIVTAFGLSFLQISNADEWTAKDLYDVEAMPPETMRSSIKDLRYSWWGIEDPKLREMLQALLMDRFQLKFHRETRTADVYLLEQSGKTLRLNPAKTAADGADLSTEHTPFGSVGYVNGKWSIFNISMLQLAKFAGDSVMRVPVLDRTGLSGSFDYRERQQDLDPVYSGDQTASFQSYLAEVGLKLERSKGPIEMFVIDHAAKPSPN